MYVLGLSCYYHDSAAALVKDGVLLAAAAEERFVRRKHTSEFPEKAVEYCLKVAGININQVDHICFYEKPFVKFDRILINILSEFPRSYFSFLKSIPLWMKDRLWMKSKIQEALGVEKEILFSQHHLSHAAAAFLVSPFERAAILTVDGVGEWCTTGMGYGEGNQIHMEKEIDFPHSLGLFYSALTAYLGFKVNDAEWKVMGLAPYGTPRYVDKFNEIIDIKSDGSFRLNLKYFSHHYATKLPFSRHYENLFGQTTRDPESEITQFHKDMAASGQKVVEKVMVTMAQNAYDTYKTENICIAGGVGLNSVANWKILKNTPFRNIFIQPAAGDDGAAIGAAFIVYNTVLNNPRRFVMTHAYWGPEFTNAEIKAFLDSTNVRYQELSEAEMLKKTAKLIADDKVVGWFQGRMEFGPRALGGRSILANPSNPEMKNIINSKIKFREWFRPFAPSVLKESVSKYFDMEGDSPFMLLVPDVLQDKRALLPAITHEDGTGRVQTVTESDNRLYYKLIKEFENISGIPVVVNTSFNVRGEPIVCSPADAYNCFIRTGIDALVMGNYVLTEKPFTNIYTEEEIVELEGAVKLAKKGKTTADSLV
ncbi:MAG: carbamoyltransferase [Blastocatellia bacterium]